jgi:hypothetical protein
LAVALFHHHGRFRFVYPHLALLIESHLPSLSGDFLRIVGRLGGDSRPWLSLVHPRTRRSPVSPVGASSFWVTNIGRRLGGD